MQASSSCSPLCPCVVEGAPVGTLTQFPSGPPFAPLLSPSLPFLPPVPCFLPPLQALHFILFFFFFFWKEVKGVTVRHLQSHKEDERGGAGVAAAESPAGGPARWMWLWIHGLTG